MRRIEKEMLNAVNNRRNWRKDNTEVKVDEFGTSVWLHGNCIYIERTSGTRYFTLAGWNTPTTRSRLNALGVAVTQRNWEAWYNGARINPNCPYSVK